MLNVLPTLALNMNEKTCVGNGYTASVKTSTGGLVVGALTLAEAKKMLSDALDGCLVSDLLPETVVDVPYALGAGIQPNLKVRQ